MTEVFKSEAVHTLPALAWTIFVIGAMTVMSLLCAFVAYNNDTISYIPSIGAAATAIFFYFRARENYRIINRYIHFPPNCIIVDTHSLTSDD